MSARFLRDFEHMRSYVIVDGHLHISLMADGGVYEFEPAEPLVVEGQWTGSVTGDFPVHRLQGNQEPDARHVLRPVTPGKVTLSRGGKTITIPQVQSGEWREV